VHLLGSGTVSTAASMQLEGSVLRIPFQEMKEIFRTSDEIRERVLEFVQEQFLTISHIAVCNRLHTADERLARWLLMAQDRTQSNILNFTQELIGMMLGSRRTTVSLVASGLQRRGLIQYSRGSVKILDRKALEAAACDCYPIIRNLNVNLYRKGRR
jgi:CRP-like cAMP-binding protein